MFKHSIKVLSEDHWHELRSTRIGSSDAPALFDHGYSTAPSAWSVYAMKKNVLLTDTEFDPLTRPWFGKLIEPVIAKAAAAKTGWDLEELDRYFYHPDPDVRCGATIDRLVRDHESGYGVIECKNRDYITWLDEYTEEDASVRDLIQLAHQFYCIPDIQWGAIAVLVGGNDIKIYPYQRADLQHIIDDLAVKVRWFWDLFDRNEEPPLRGTEIPDWLQVHKDDEEIADPLELDGEKEVDGITLDRAIYLYQAFDAQAKKAEKIAKNHKARIIQDIGNHGRAMTNMYDVTVNTSIVKASVVALPVGLQSRLLVEGSDAAVEAAKWNKETRKESVRRSLKITDNAAPAKDPDAVAADTLKAAAEFQKPFDDDDHDKAMMDATANWDEDGWRSDDSGVTDIDDNFNRAITS